MEKFRLSEKGEQIREMFSTIAPRYDFLNRLLSMGIDRKWRRFAVKQIKFQEGGKVLDVATGTGDLALEIAAQTPDSVKVVGADFSKGMIEIGRQKVTKSAYPHRITFEVAPCEAIPVPDDTFDSVTIAFGIRNVVDRAQGLKEMLRVLKPGGRLVILELTNPRSKAFRSVYDFYFHKLLPNIGAVFSKASAYRYLPESVAKFPSQDEFKKLLEEVGYKKVYFHELTFGIASVFVGEKS